MLWTTKDLVAARRIYDAAGFQVTGEYDEERWGASITSVRMALDL